MHSRTVISRTDMERNDYNGSDNYIAQHKYPPNASKDEKRKVRSKAAPFEAVDGQLMYRKKRRLVVQEMDKIRLLKACHSDMNGGGHFGRDKTFFKLSERYFWKAMKADVEDFIKCCDVC